MSVCCEDEWLHRQAYPLPSKAALEKLTGSVGWLLVGLKVFPGGVGQEALRLDCRPDTQARGSHHLVDLICVSRMIPKCALFTPFAGRWGAEVTLPHPHRTASCQ